MPDHQLQEEKALRWRERFRFDQVKVLIVGRGPIRLEAIRAFDGMGAQPSGILLSEKDSVVYRRALAPELRLVGRNERVHRIPDYGAGVGEDKSERVEQILAIALEGGYSHIFSGYGFMAEDHEFIRSVERAGLGFVGPSSAVVQKVGAKDAAKALARRLGISVTPGVDNITALSLLHKAETGGEATLLKSVAKAHGLKPPAGWSDSPPEEAAAALLGAALAKGVELVTIPELQAEARRQAARILRRNPGARLRLKHVGGGGGKGQRIISTPAQTAAAVLEVLNEAGAMGAGEERNFLMELNIEESRHNEIQLMGNGDWCIALGGRDCSLQMHEQKLLELSITAEMLEAEAARLHKSGGVIQEEVLREDLAVLGEMEAEAEKLGTAVGLDSASTFESIVAGREHYFMEVNTRIQVEHRVTEMVYALRFADPEEPSAWFEVDSLVEAMLWTAVHGAGLPRPKRLPRHGSGAEVRINATDDALRPHAGGIVLDWSPPIENEIRDDQGIGIGNPDTATFMHYNLAGAYDSNAALVVSHGDTREENLERLVEILRRMEIRGEGVMTNRAFHYGLLHWLLGAGAMAKPTTRFVQSYLAAVGALKLCSADLELDMAWRGMMEKAASYAPGGAETLAVKITLIPRPLHQLYGQPHLLAGWLAPRRERRWVVEKGRFIWRRNPLEVLEQLYHYLRLEEHPGVSPEEQIWEADRILLNRGLAFYSQLRERLGRPEMDWGELDALLEQSEPPKGLTRRLWNRTVAAHRGHQLGLELLKLPIVTGEEAGFYGLTLNPRLEPVIPEAFGEEGSAREKRAALSPPPTAGGDRIVAWTGGTFYGRPSPTEQPFLGEGSHFKTGDQMGLLEVMKMFNPLRAEFSGTVTEVLVDLTAAVIVQKGQPLFMVRPDTPVEKESPEQALDRKRRKTNSLLKLL